MLGESKLKDFLALVKASSDAELAWMNGYLSGVISRAEPATSAPAALSHPGKITIVYGTETGNSKKLATSFATRAKKIGINAKVIAMDQYKVADLPKEEYFFSIVSTHGEGDPPAAAKKFYDHIHQNGFKLEKLKYGVLALGDTSYALFCQTGEDVDTQLEKLGGERIVPLQKCDVDYDEEAGEWFDRAFKAISLNGSAPEIATAPSLAPAKKSSGRKIFHEKVLTSVNLNDRGSNKITQHIELSAESIEYLPGDSIGVIPENPVKVVEEILSLLSISHDHQVQYKNESTNVAELLQKKLNIFYLPERVVTRFGDAVGTRIQDSRADLLDLLKRHPFDGSSRVEELVGLLEPIAPRLYSISSSPEAHSGEIHITVAKNNYTIDDELKYGLTSDFLCQLQAEEKLSFYIHPNSLFRLPEPERDIIMIGPGTGIAPFRAFISHRDSTGATGKSWLFFGEQHFLTDFFYQTEIQNWLETGVLTKASVAFSRDQREKIYVQHKMIKDGALFFEWLESGAIVYVCGTKDPMSVDVESALVSIISSHGERTEEEALQYIDQMKEDGRYLKDVY